MKSVRSIGVVALLVLCGCSTHHWAPVEASKLPPPPGPVERHTSRVIIDVSSSTGENQCVVYEQHHPVCFYNVRPALKAGLSRALWPSFPEVLVGRAEEAKPGDYVLQVDVELDALPPDGQGPGWSAGARGRFRLLRDGEVLHEETTASRSRPHFAYGGPLGEGATETLDATVQHIAQAVFQVPEARPDQPTPLPQVAYRNQLSASKNPQPASESIPAASATEPADGSAGLDPPPPALAKSADENETKSESSR